MDTFYQTNLAVHVVFGLTGLLVMIVPLLTRKGARMHRRFGWIFVTAMALVALTGIDMSLAWLAAPKLFRPNSSFETVLVDALFLILIGALTANALAQAIFALRQKGRLRAAPGPLVKTLFILLGLSASTSIVVGIQFRELLSIVFGAGALALLISDLRFSFRPFASPHAYLYQHINAVGTACISTLTAFLVLGARRVLGAEVLGAQAWLLWLAPSVLFAPVFQIWIARYRRQLEGSRNAQTNGQKPLMQHG
jgi:hypothetical protein